MACYQMHELYESYCSHACLFYPKYITKQQKANYVFHEYMKIKVQYVYFKSNVLIHL